MSDKCVICHQKLGLFSRSHTCSKCGVKLCHSCSQKIDVKDVNPITKAIMQHFGIYDFSISSFWGQFRGNEYFCPECMRVFYNAHATIDFLLNRADSVVVGYSSNYKGRKPACSERVWYETEFYKNRNDAMLEIKTAALYRGFKFVMDYSFVKETSEKETDSGGVYYFAIWRVAGFLARPSH